MEIDPSELITVDEVLRRRLVKPATVAEFLTHGERLFKLRNDDRYKPGPDQSLHSFLKGEDEDGNSDFHCGCGAYVSSNRGHDCWWERLLATFEALDERLEGLQHKESLAELQQDVWGLIEQKAEEDARKLQFVFPGLTDDVGRAVAAYNARLDGIVHDQQVAEAQRKSLVEQLEKDEKDKEHKEKALAKLLDHTDKLGQTCDDQAKMIKLLVTSVEKLDADNKALRQELDAQSKGLFD